MVFTLLMQTEFPSVYNVENHSFLSNSPGITIIMQKKHWLWRTNTNIIN